MDKSDVRAKLLDHFTKKNEAQIKNIFSLVAITFGILLTEKIDKIPEPYSFNISELIISLLPMMLYFVIKARYWSEMMDAILYVRPKILKNNKEYQTPDEQNYFAQLHHSCKTHLRNQKKKLLRIFPVNWAFTNNFKIACICLTLILIPLFGVIEWDPLLFLVNLI